MVVVLLMLWLWLTMLLLLLLHLLNGLLRLRMLVLMRMIQCRRPASAATW